jgi:hypothetical protein
MEEQLGAIDPSLVHLDCVGVAAVRAGRLNPSVDAERAEDTQSVPGAVCIPPPVSCVHAVRGGHGGERIRHPNLVCRRIEDERVRLMKLPPSGFHLALVSELAGTRRAPEIDERRIGPVAKVDQPGVDRLNLYPPSHRRIADHRAVGQA